MSRQLRMTRRFRAPPERVFEAWRDPDLLRTWFGCGPGQLWTVHVWDCRSGGALRHGHGAAPQAPRRADGRRPGHPGGGVDPRARQPVVRRSRCRQPQRLNTLLQLSGSHVQLGSGVNWLQEGPSSQSSTTSRQGASSRHDSQIPSMRAAGSPGSATRLPTP
ncbi:MAG: SRPBCC domain-containing protein [Myxococcales bacterium]|nr:SRPBCC domain-containing protein [Myxococcales bacterium]